MCNPLYVDYGYVFSTHTVCQDLVVDLPCILCWIMVSSHWCTVNPFPAIPTLPIPRASRTLWLETRCLRCGWCHRPKPSMPFSPAFWKTVKRTGLHTCLLHRMSEFVIVITTRYSHITLTWEAYLSIQGLQLVKDFYWM